MNNCSEVVVTTSWDDGDPMDIKLADLLSEFCVNGTFYVAPRNRERPVMETGILRGLGERFEIGAHSVTHRKLPLLSAQDLREEVSGSKMELEDILAKPVIMFCYPKGMYNRDVRQAVISAGFVGARTVKHQSHVSQPLQCLGTLAEKKSAQSTIVLGFDLGCGELARVFFMVFELVDDARLLLQGGAAGGERADSNSGAASELLLLRSMDCRAR